MIDVLVVSPGSLLGPKIICNCLNNAGIKAEMASIPDDDIEKILSLKPKIISINWGFVQSSYDFIMDILPIVRTLLPDTKFVFGGYNSTYDWPHLKDYKYCDAIVGGEADDSIVACCKEILENGTVDQLKYLHTPLPDLSKYDYDNNIVELERSLIFETGRSCIFAMNNRCWYCSQYRTPYRSLDIEKIKQAIHKRLKPGQCLVVTTPEILPETLNELYHEFKVPVFCFMVPQHYSRVADDVKDCWFSTGYDIFKDKSLKCNQTKDYLDDILRLSKDNKIVFSSVILEKEVPPETKKEMERIKAISNNIRIQYCSFIEYPGVDDKPYYKDLYQKKDEILVQNLKLQELDDFGNDLVEMPQDFNTISETFKFLEKHKIDTEQFKYKSFLDRLEIEIILTYEILGIQGFVTKKENKEKLQKLCLIETCDTNEDYIKCVFIKEGKK